MDALIEDIAERLKQARENKGLSQRALSELSGVPQGHISKIENASVDLRLSSLIALARALDLELVLSPRKSVAAVRSIIRSTDGSSTTSASVRSANQELTRLQHSLKAAQAQFPDSRELAQIRRHAQDLQHMVKPSINIDALTSVRRTIESIQKNSAQNAVRKMIGESPTASLRKALENVQTLRNSLAHSPLSEIQDSAPRPAYRLEEDDG